MELGLYKATYKEGTCLTDGRVFIAAESFSEAERLFYQFRHPGWELKGIEKYADSMIMKPIHIGVVEDGGEKFEGADNE